MTPFFSKFKPGDILIINRQIIRKIQYMNVYDSFRKMLESETLGRVCPKLGTIDDAVTLYRTIYKKKVGKYKILAIAMSLYPMT